MKRWFLNRKEICATHVTNKKVVPKLYTKLLQTHEKEDKQPVGRQAEVLTRPFKPGLVKDQFTEEEALTITRDQETADRRHSDIILHLNGLAKI